MYKSYEPNNQKVVNYEKKMGRGALSLQANDCIGEKKI